MNELATQLERAGSPKLLVVGDVILDRYAWGHAERVSPEAPVVVLRADEDEIRLGGAASVAYLLRGLGAQVTLAGVIGDDANGRLIRRLHCPRRRRGAKHLDDGPDSASSGSPPAHRVAEFVRIPTVPVSP